MSSPDPDTPAARAQLRAGLAGLEPAATAYAGQVLRLLGAYGDGLVARKLRENLTGWGTLSEEERRARHLRALAILGGAAEDFLPASASAPPGLAAEAESAGPADEPEPDRPPDVTRWRASEDLLRTPLTELAGIGRKRADVLIGKGLRNFKDLLYWLPHRYENREERRTLSGVPGGAMALVQGRVVARGDMRLRRFPQAFRIDMALDSGPGLALIWFRASKPQKDFLQRSFAIGQPIEAAGTLEFFEGRPSFIHPDVGQPGKLARGMLPVYSETEGITSRNLRAWVGEVLARTEAKLEDPLPPEIRRDWRLHSRDRALREMHLPRHKEADPADPAYPPRQRLVFDEFLLIALGMLIRKAGYAKKRAAVVPQTDAVVDQFRATLPFPLTGAQVRSLAEIGVDLARGAPMHRLVQGDVGSGKTLVALGAAAATVRAGFQAALMAPTELLAEQHLRNTKRYLDPLGIESRLLTGSTKAAERREIRDRLAAGEPMVVVGTHALIEPEVGFTRLALAIIDEQHRFGVHQRAKLAAVEGEPPHVLIMTATPIPRTLAMTLYGDLDVSVLDEMPPGRKPVETVLIADETDRRGLMGRLKTELAAGRQAYWVFPLIEESEKVDLKDATRAAELLARALPETRVDLLHGRMSAAEKDAAMGRFLRGETGVLVSTTVIEVGVDVPNATLMVIEHADRFGLSQLHQLRGRVGRGSDHSYCFLRVDHLPRGDAAARLGIMTETNDGFRIAEADLEIRGSGDLLGTRQSGLPSLNVANPVRDARMLGAARDAALRILEGDPELQRDDHAALRLWLEETWRDKGMLVG